MLIEMLKKRFFNLHINYMAAFDWIKLLRLKKITEFALFVVVFWGETQTQEITVVHCVAKWYSDHLVQVYRSYPISCSAC